MAKNTKFWTLKKVIVTILIVAFLIFMLSKLGTFDFFLSTSIDPSSVSSSSSSGVGGL